MKVNWFYLITTILCVVITGTAAIIFFAQEPVSNVGLVCAWIFWLFLPLAVYHELFFSRHRDKEDYRLYQLRKHRRDYSKLAKAYSSRHQAF